MKPTAPKHEGKHIVTTKTGGVLHILTCERCGKGFKAMDEAAKLCHDCKAAESRKRAGRRTARRVLVDGVEYASMGKAAEAIGCTMPAVKEALDKGRTSIKGFAIEEVRPSSGQVAAK